MFVRKMIIMSLMLFLNGCLNNPYSESYAWYHFLFNVPPSHKESLYESLGEYSRCIAYDLGKLNATGNCDIDKRRVSNVLKYYNFKNISLKPAMGHGMACMTSFSQLNHFIQTLTTLAGGPGQSKINLTEYQQICAKKLLASKI